MSLRHFSLILMLLLFSCEKKVEKQKTPITEKDSAQIVVEQAVKYYKPLSKEEEKKRSERRQVQADWDSLQRIKMIDEALQLAIKNSRKRKYALQYEYITDSMYGVKIKLESGYVFSNKNRHVMVRSDFNGTMYFDVFLAKGKKFSKLFSYDLNSLAHTNDTILDINGDGVKDLSIESYSLCGSFLKGFTDVFLLKQDQKDFTEGFGFLNATFSPKEHIVRGVGYGPPGEADLYKYRWNGVSIDTVEFVSNERNSKKETTGRILITNKQSFKKDTKVLRRLNSVPKEYRKIKDFDWFADNTVK